MFYIALIIFSLLIVALDQITKYLVVANIELYEVVPVWDGVVHLTHIRNTGMAFSMLEGGRWLFLVLTVIALGLIVFAIKKNWVTHKASIWSLAAIAGGAVGNLIDRVRLGYVVDMIEVEFMEFAVFNAADSFVVCGAIALVICILFLEDKKKEKSHDSDSGQDR